MGLNKDGLQRFDAVAASHVGDDQVPGLVALVAHGDDVHVEALGTLAVGGRPVERASLFRIASRTKPITATATLALVREGLLELMSRSTGCCRSSQPAGCCAGWTAGSTTRFPPTVR